jgi:hypothetical protein
MRLIDSESYLNQEECIKLHRRDASIVSSKKTNMQTTTLKSSDVARNAHVVRIWRSPKRNRSQRQRVVPSAAMYRPPPSKWTVVAAFILAVMLHAGAVVWIEMQQEKPPLEVGAPVLIHSMEKVVFETGAGTGATGAAD